MVEVGGASESRETCGNVCLVPMALDSPATLTGFLLSLYPSLSSNLLALRAEFKAVTGNQITTLIK